MNRVIGANYTVLIDNIILIVASLHILYTTGFTFTMISAFSAAISA